MCNLALANDEEKQKEKIIDNIYNNKLCNYIIKFFGGKIVGENNGEDVVVYESGVKFKFIKTIGKGTFSNVVLCNRIHERLKENIIEDWVIVEKQTSITDLVFKIC